MFDVVTIGGALIDSFLTLQDANTHCRIDKQGKLLMVDFGQKIMLEKCEFLVGGNAANVGVGLARLGLKTAIMAEIGNDEFAEKIVHTFHKENLDMTYLLHDDAPSSFAVNLYFQGERTIFVQHHKRAHAFALDNLQAKWLYLTSVGESWKHVYRSVKSFLVSNPQVNLAFNPGTKQIEGGYEQVVDLLPVAKIFIANKEEYARLLKVDKADALKLLKLMRSKTQAILVLTDGEKGSYVLSADDVLTHAEIITSPMRGKTGAGDAFSSGFLASYLRQADIREAMRLGSANAASVVRHIGAQTGLLHKNELAKWRQKMEEIQIS